MSDKQELARVRLVRVANVSPSDVAEERNALVGVVGELNRGLAKGLGLHLELWRWEDDGRPGYHAEGMQGGIDRDLRIQEVDVVVGIFWARFGTPTAGAPSGTAGELQDAWESTAATGRPEIMLYFNQAPTFPRSSADAEQTVRVLRFKEEGLPQEVGYWEYSGVAEFEQRVREHLGRFLRDELGDPAPAAGPTSSVQGGPLRFNIPIPSASFSGRTTELETLDTMLADPGPVAITGLGGVGKSELAAQYVATREDAYQVVAWVRAQDGGIDDLSRLAAELDPSVAGLHPEDRAAAALTWLSRCDAPWLLVLDDVQSPQQLEKLQPRSSSGRVLAISRDRGLGQLLRPLKLGEFDEDTAVKYLMESAPQAGDEAAARKLAKALGTLPLALVHASAYCSHITTFDAYRELLRELPAPSMFSGNGDARRADPIAYTWRASMEAATEAAALSPELLAMAAYLSPDPIQNSLFDIVFGSDPHEKKQLLDALSALHRFSLADVDHSTTTVHRLVQKAVRDDPGRKGDRTGWQRAVRAVAAAFPKDPTARSAWGSAEQLQSHALMTAETLEPAGEDAERLIELLNRVCFYLNSAERGQRAVEVAERTAAQAKKLLGSKHQATLTARDTLAYVYWTVGQYERALEFQLEVLADRERFLGADHLDTLTSANHAAYSYWSLGNTDDSIPLHERVVRGRERALGPKHPETLVARHELAIAYRSAGRLDEAIAIQDEVLAVREALLGPDDPHTVRARLERALSYRAEGEIERAIELLTGVLADRERLLGDEHPHTIFARHMLASCHAQLNAAGEAIALEEQVVEQRTRVLGPDHPDTRLAREELEAFYLARERGGAEPT